MPHLENMTSDICTGCSACEKICPKAAVKLTADSEGFLVPEINEQECVNCGLCTDVCQVKPEQEKTHYDNIAFAVRHKNDEIRKSSASGAYFQALARHFIKNNGYVCGCVLENMRVVHIVSNNIDDLKRMADSKYVQSDMKNCFAEIAELLKNQKPVLFTGTSCQAAGLKMYLSNKKVDVSKLLTVDFFCHGVPSPLIWKEYLTYYEKKTHRKPIYFRWRCKDYGWGKAAKGSNYFNTMFYSDNKKDRSAYVRSWRNIFFSDFVVRRKCHDCDYCTIDKPADITIGDFWKLDEILPDFDDGRGTSVVIVHKSENLKYVTELSDVEYREVAASDAVKGQLNAFQPSKANKMREKFWQDYFENGFEYTLRKYIYTDAHVIKSKIKMLLFLFKLKNYN